MREYTEGELPRGYLVRFTVNGTVETNFSRAPFGNRIDAVRVAGSQIVATTNDGNRTAVVRYNWNGSVDTTWGSGGTAILGAPINGQLLALEVQAWDGKVVAAGYGFRVGDTRGFQSAFVVRLNANGTPDLTFGKNGNGTYENSVGAGFAGYVGVTFLADHTILAMGQVQVGGASRPTGLVSRFGTNGALYPSFALGGNFVEDGAPYVSSFFAQTALRIDETATNSHVMLVGTNHTGAALMQYAMSVL